MNQSTPSPFSLGKPRAGANELAVPACGDSDAFLDLLAADLFATVSVTVSTYRMED